MLWCVVDAADLSYLRIAAARWAKEHSENKNSKRVLRAVEECHPKDHEWIPDNKTKEN